MPKGKILMGKKAPVPMPKAKSGKPAPKGGKVIEKKLPPKNVYKGVMKKNEARPEPKNTVRTEVLKTNTPMVSYLRRPKPSTRRGGK